MIIRTVVPLEVDKSIPLIDEEFDAAMLDLPLGYEWAAVACDEEEWDDYD